ncbi:MULTISPECIES: Dyp-type peroxidase domain-containing protein [Pseudomonas putida group]|uniref:Dyp-type peroxidase domain-containing protein n=1 Tax=Pseudomonas putida group TaxID=136845 RepID=UPI00048DDFE3
MDHHEIEPQAVDGAVTRSAIFLVATLNPSNDSRDRVRDLCADLGGLVRSVGKRVPSGNLSCVIGFGAAVWDSLFGTPRPAGLHAFREFGSGERKAVATPGDQIVCCRS